MLRSTSSDEIISDTNLSAQKLPDQGASNDAYDISCAQSWEFSLIA